MELSNMMKCDRDGVPRLIQDMVYDYTYALWRVRLFTGGSVEFEAPEVGLIQRTPTRIQQLQAAQRITRDLENNFSAYQTKLSESERASVPAVDPNPTD